MLPAYGIGRSVQLGLEDDVPTVGAGLTSFVLYMRKLGPYMYGTP